MDLLRPPNGYAVNRTAARCRAGPVRLVLPQGTTAQFSSCQQSRLDGLLGGDSRTHTQRLAGVLELVDQPCDGARDSHTLTAQSGRFVSPLLERFDGGLLEVSGGSRGNHFDVGHPSGRGYCKAKTHPALNPLIRCDEGIPGRNALDWELVSCKCLRRRRSACAIRNRRYRRRVSRRVTAAQRSRD